MTLNYETVIKRFFSKKNVLLLTGTLLALIIAATIIHGLIVLGFAVVALISAFVVELMFAKGRKIAFDEAWMIYPLLLTLLVPSTLEFKFFWMVAVGSAFGTFFGKSIFGGSGKYVFNPALVGLLFITVSFPAYFPTMLVKTSQIGSDYTFFEMLLGSTPGAFGETLRLVIIALGIILIFYKVIDWKIPVTILVSVFAFVGIGHLIDDTIFPNAFNSLVVGNLILVSFFVATDETTMPITTKGRVLYGIGIALLTVMIRYFATYPEGTMFAIILMSAVAPLIDHLFKSKGGELNEA